MKPDEILPSAKDFMQKLAVAEAEEASKEARKHAEAEAEKKIDAFLKLCKEYEVTPVCFGVQRFTKDHEANRKIFEFGKAMGLRAFSADPDPDSFDSLDKLCGDYDVDRDRAAADAAEVVNMLTTAGLLEPVQ